MEEIILYSNHCPQCKYLETLLRQKGISYQEVNDEDLMISMGLMSMPQLKVNGITMKYADALQWVNNK